MQTERTYHHTRRPLNLRDPALVLDAAIRERLRLSTVREGVERVARHLGVRDRALLSAIAGVPTTRAAAVLAAVTARGLP